MKRHALRRLRATLLAEQCWAIHEPALAMLAEMLAAGGSLNRLQINERLGIDLRVPLAAESESTVQMVGQVAVLPVMGVLQQRPSWITRALGWTATEQLEKDLRAAAANDQVKAIVLYCDSPGGVAGGVDEVAATIHKSRGSKPIRGFVRGQCCSAAYYLLSQADKITAGPTSTVGSIGVISVMAEYSKALAEMGIKINIVKYGARKADGNPYEPMGPEARAALQNWVDSFGQLFDAAVARGRGVTPADVRTRMGQGQFFLAAEAKQRGLIDQVGAWEDVLASLRTPAAPLPQAAAATSVAQLLAAGPWLQAPDARLPIPDLHLSASADPAGALAGPFLTSHSSSERPPMKVSARVRAALFARGLIQAQECDDAICLAALGAFFAARGEACPQEDDKVVAALFVQQAAAAAPAAAPPAAPPPAPGAAANVQQAHDREMSEARTQAATGERERIAAINASAQLLNMPADAVATAIASGDAHDKVVAAWHQQLGRREPGITQGQTPITVGQDGAARFAADATLSLQIKLGHQVEGPQVTEDVRRRAQAPLLYFAQQALQMHGIRVDAWAAPEEVFEQAFAMEGFHHVNLNAAGPFNRPGSFPNLMSSLANKILDEGLELADPTYPEWTGLWPSDLPDFKAAPVANKSQLDELDEVLDADASKEFGLQEEMLSYMQLARYSNKFGLTPVMAANDDLNAFTEGLLGLSMAHENTLNRLCLGLLTANVTLLDSVALYDDSTHANVIASGGGAPSVTQWDLMERKLAAQRGIGGTGYIRTQLGVALVPPAHRLAALQTFLPLPTLGEIKQPTADTSINVYRGTVNVVVEPELAGSSSAIWYGFARPKGMMNATVIRAYFRGWGRTGRRQRWYDPNTKCWYTELEGRMGAAAKQYRLTVRNPGS